MSFLEKGIEVLSYYVLHINLNINMKNLSFNFSGEAQEV